MGNTGTVRGGGGIGRRLLAAVMGLWVVLAAAKPSFAFHVCPSLSDTLAPLPKQGPGVSSAKAVAALAKMREALAKGHTLPPGQLKKVLGEYALEFRALARDDPAAAALALQTMPEAIQSFAQAKADAAAGCVPEPVMLTGTLSAYVIAPPPGADTLTTAQITQPVLIADNGSLYALQVDPMLALQGKSRRVRVRGRLLVRDLIVAGDGAGIDSLDPVSDAPGFHAPPAYAKGTLRLLCTAVSFADSVTTQTPVQLDADCQRVKAYYEETSDHQLTVQVTTFPRIITVAAPTTCGPFEDHQLVLPLIDAEVDFRTVDVWTITSPYTVCPWGGVAYLDPISLATADGTVALGFNLDRAGSPSVISHEVGHNVSLHHGAEYFAAEWFPLGDLSTWTEYKNPFNVLGQSASFGPFGVIHRLALGWLQPGVNVMTDPVAGQRYTVIPVSSTTPGWRGVCARLSVDNLVCVEHRRPVNQWEQTNAATKPFGCQITSSGHAGGGYAHDAVHKFGSRLQPGCQVGDRITAPTGLDMTIESITDTGIVVRVDSPGVPDLVRPVVTLISPTPWMAIRGPVNVEFTVADARAWRATASLYSAGRYRFCPAVLTSGGAVSIPCDPTTAPALVNGSGYVYAAGDDALGNRTTVGTWVVIDVGGTGTTTTFASTTLVSTTTSTTTTTDPLSLVTIVDSDNPDPSAPATIVKVCAHGEQSGATVPIDILYIATTPHCLAPSAGPCCDWTSATVGTFPIAVYVHSPTVGWSPAPAWITHIVQDGTSTTSTVTTTSSTSSTGPTSSTSPPPTTTSSTTSSSTTTTRASTSTTTSSTLVPCRSRGVSCVLGGVKHPELCCSRRCGGARKCK